MLQEKHRTTELANDKMSEMIQALESETLQLQKALEDATHAVKLRYALLKNLARISSYMLNTSSLT